MAMNTDIVTFARQFLAKLAPLPIQYEETYNAPTRRTTPASGAARKPTVSVVNVTLKRLHGKSGVTHVKLSRTEPTLVKLRREASSLLGCDVAQVVLVQDGKVLADGDVAAVASNAALPVYVFGRQSLFESPSLDNEFRREFIDLLKKYRQTHPAFLADRFLESYSDWLASQ